MTKTLALLPVLASLALGADWIPRGTNIEVRTDETIRVKSTEGDGRIYRGFVSRDVLDRDGAMVVPRGANAELIVRRVGKDEVAVDLDSITVNGHRYGVAATETEAEATRTGKSHIGALTGGGAVLGTILGAVAGGGKGAAIGAVAGAGAGAATGLATRGRSLNVPVESLLTFRLEQPIRIDARDTGYDRDGHHYHDR